MANAVPDIELTKNKENDISESETMVTTIKVAEAEQPVKIETTKQNFSTLIQKDGTKILLLLYLYFLQGIPLGLSSSIPFLLSIRSISYSDQGTFSFASWPFSIKLLWAPIVDSLYIYKFGRRKSWLIPVQLLIAIFLLCFASSSKSLVESGSSKSDIIFLTSIFFTLNFLAATQDICVDGWAITMLSE
jgi:PAT family acetyl-CoA transporter-like MFS transporter 1